MKLAKSLLLGSAAALVATAGASAADLPSKKAAPVQYVKVCDTYGAGFFNIPGTDTCLKVGGRVRADYAFVAADSTLNAPAALPFSALSTATTYATGTRLNVSDAVRDARAAHTNGWEARGRVDIDARTATGYGTVQTVAAIRLSRTTGVLATDFGAQSASASPTLEAAFVRFAGFTFGASRDNFAFMPSRFYGAGHWGSFANGAKQIAYTAVLGGGLSATVALQDPVDTTVGGFDHTWRHGAGAGSVGSKGPVESNRMPQINARIDFDQAWGSLSLTGAARQIDVNSTVKDRFAETANAWAAGLGVKINLPQLAKGDALWLTAAYADGMTEYTTNWSSFKSSAYRRDVGGIVINHPSFVAFGGEAGQTGVYDNGLATVQSWNVAAVFDHFWSPEWRSSFMGSYGAIKAPSQAKNCTAGLSNSSRMNTTSGNTTDANAINGCFGDATVMNIGKQLAWLPARNLELGVEVLYARTSMKMPNGGSGTTDASIGCNASAGQTCSFNNWSGRLRVERTF